MTRRLAVFQRKTSEKERDSCLFPRNSGLIFCVVRISHVAIVEPLIPHILKSTTSSLKLKMAKTHSTISPRSVRTATACMAGIRIFAETSSGNGTTCTKM